ncbi:MAG: hypothetical protein KAI83_17560, partial [Thiomargarita sp.]|nr:hypothetical protein [Thiomargarita sp.]
LADVSEPQTEYKYNLDKQLIEITRPDDRVVTFDYDAEKGRLNAITLPNRQLNYHYDAQTGNLNSIVSPDDTILMYTYDGSLALSETWGAGNPVIGRVSLTYDNDFRVASSQVNGRYTVNYEYDTDSLLIRSGFLALDYHPQTGFLTDTHLGDLTTERVYNRFAEIESVTAAYKESALYQSEYSYDKLGRITQKVEIIEGNEITYAYRYDKAGRLVEVTEDGAVTNEYSYDSNGNRLSADTSNGFFEGSYDEQDRLVQYGDTVYKYTKNGELKSKDSGGVSTEYEYDVLGNLRTVTLADKKIEYIIDARSRRIGKWVDGKFTQGFLYQGSLNPIAELDAIGDVVTRFVYGSKANVPDYMLKGEKIYRILSDHLGSPRLVVDISDGTVVQRMDYDVFGNVTDDTNQGFQPFGFAGGLYDHETGLVRFGARDYDPEIGRWTTKDPILFDGGDTNLYGYVVNDPVNLIDPQGTFFDIIADIGFVAYDIYRIAKDNIFGECGNLGSNITALGADVGAIFVPFATGGGLAVRAGMKTAKRKITVIGRTKDLKNLKPNEQSLLSRLPDKGNPRANWKQNSGVLRQEMSKGQPIRDASPGDTAGQFLNAERNLLKDRGWTFNSKTNYWMPQQ